jgi:hypothetical protein
MNVTPEYVAKLIFHISNMRYFEKQYQNDPCWENRDLMLVYQRRIDEFLILNDFDKFLSYEELLFLITDEQLKKAV